MRATLTLATMKGLPGSSPRALAVVAWAVSRSCLDMPAVHSAVLQMVRRLTLNLPLTYQGRARASQEWWGRVAGGALQKPCAMPPRRIGGRACGEAAAGVSAALRLASSQTRAHARRPGCARRALRRASARGWQRQRREWGSQSGWRAAAAPGSLTRVRARAAGPPPGQDGRGQPGRAALADHGQQGGAAGGLAGRVCAGAPAIHPRDGCAGAPRARAGCSSPPWCIRWWCWASPEWPALPVAAAPCCASWPATPWPGAGCRARSQRRGPAPDAAAAVRGLPRCGRAAGARARRLAAAARRAQRVTGGRRRADAVPHHLHLLRPPALPPGPAAGREEPGAAALRHLP